MGLSDVRLSAVQTCLFLCIGPGSDPGKDSEVRRAAAALSASHRLEWRQTRRSTRCVLEPLGAFVTLHAYVVLYCLQDVYLSYALRLNETTFALTVVERS